MKKIMKNWSLFEKVWLIVFTSIGLFLSIAWGESLLGLITFLTGIICVVLVAKGSLWNYSFGVINVVLYAYLSYQNKLFGEVMLNMIYYLPMQFIGYKMWKNAMGNNSEVIKKKLNLKQNSGLALASIVSILGYNQLLIFLDGQLTILDSMSTCLSVIAMLLMAFRYREQWMLWIIVNIVSVIMWVNIGDPMMILMWSAYLINAIYGFVKWSKK